MRGKGGYGKESIEHTFDIFYICIFHCNNAVLYDHSCYNENLCKWIFKNKINMISYTSAEKRG